MCGSAANGGSSSASGSGSAEPQEVVPVGIPPLPVALQEPESTAARTSVLRRTASYQGNPGQSPASLAFSASVVTRHHSYNIQMQRSGQPGRMGPSGSGVHVQVTSPGLLDLPIELIEKILGYVEYKKISNLRMVSATCAPSLTLSLSPTKRWWLLNQ